MKNKIPRSTKCPWYKHCSSRKQGFSLVELIVVITILMIVAVMAIPEYLLTQKRKNLIGTVAELESILKDARNKALTGSQATETELPTGGYGVYVSTLPGKNAESISFLDTYPTENNFLDDTEITDTSAYRPNVTTYALPANTGPFCVDPQNPVVQLSIVFQPPRADAVIKGKRQNDAIDDPPIDLAEVVIVLSLASSDKCEDQKNIVVVRTTGTIQINTSYSICGYSCEL
jgi:prepilin-type N-terminal cleavage/methylation domain-containing protein